VVTGNEVGDVVDVVDGTAVEAVGGMVVGNEVGVVVGVVNGTAVGTFDGAVDKLAVTP
jgi:hypothetical protein